MSTILIAFLACVATAVVHGQEENFQLSYIAEQMDQYCGLRGGVTKPLHARHNAPAFHVGKAGPRGPPGVVNYTTVRVFIEQEVEKKVNVLREEIASLRSSLNRTRISNTNPELCKVLHNGKCFWAIPTSQPKLQALALCEAKGGHAANIYSAAHFEAIRQYLSTVASDGEDYFTGMEYSPETSAVTLRDGSEAPYVKWYTGAPYSGDDVAVIMFDSHSLADSSGYWNRNGEGSQEGVLCEI